MSAAASEPESRRGFLAKAWRLLGLAAAAEAVLVAGAFLWPRRNRPREGARLLEAGPVSDFTPSSVTPFPAARFYLVRLADGGFLALSSTCSHLECSVPWNEKEKTFPCPCHGSVFDLTGDVKSPPAPRPLDLLPVSIEGGIVRVDTARKVKRERFEPSQVVRL